MEVTRSARDGNPVTPAGSLDEVPVPPVIFRVLGIVIENKQVGLADEVKKTFPGKVITLKYDDPLPVHTHWIST